MSCVCNSIKSYNKLIVFHRKDPQQSQQKDDNDDDEQPDFSLGPAAQVLGSQQNPTSSAGNLSFFTEQYPAGGNVAPGAHQQPSGLFQGTGQPFQFRGRGHGMGQQEIQPSTVIVQPDLNIPPPPIPQAQMAYNPFKTTQVPTPSPMMQSQQQQAPQASFVGMISSSQNIPQCQGSLSQNIAQCQGSGAPRFHQHQGSVSRNIGQCKGTVSQNIQQRQPSSTQNIQQHQPSGSQNVQQSFGGIHVITFCNTERTRGNSQTNH